MSNERKKATVPRYAVGILDECVVAVRRLCRSTSQSPGIYTMEASNSVGWSNAFTVNAPLIDWIYNFNPWIGQSSKLVGRNLDYSEYGGTTNTQVRLVNGGSTYPATVTSVNPYAIVFTVPTCPNQVYTVQVSSN